MCSGITYDFYHYLVLQNVLQQLIQSYISSLYYVYHPYQICMSHCHVQLYFHHHRVNLKYINSNVSMLNSNLYQYTIHKLQPSIHCLFSLIFTHTQRLLQPCDKPRTNVYLNPVICPKHKNRVVQFLNFYNPQPTVY